MVLISMQRLINDEKLFLVLIFLNFLETARLQALIFLYQKSVELAIEIRMARGTGRFVTCNVCGRYLNLALDQISISIA